MLESIVTLVHPVITCPFHTSFAIRWVPCSQLKMCDTSHKLIRNVVSLRMVGKNDRQGRKPGKVCCPLGGKGQSGKNQYDSSVASGGLAQVICVISLLEEPSLLELREDGPQGTCGGGQRLSQWGLAIAHGCTGCTLHNTRESFAKLRCA